MIRLQRATPSLLARLATCGRVINMMSWEVTKNPCPES